MVDISQKLLKKRDSYRLANQATSVAQKTESNLLKNLRKHRNHPNKYIVETPYQPAYVLIAKSPFRVCEVCGYSEKAWPTGYKKLADKKAREVSREQAYKLKSPLKDL